MIGTALLMFGVGLIVGDWPFRRIATVPDGESEMTVRSGELGEQFDALQTVNVMGLTSRPRLSVAVACPRWSKLIVTG